MARYFIVVARFAPLGASRTRGIVTLMLHRLSNRPLIALVLATTALTGGTFASLALVGTPAAFAQDQPSAAAPSSGRARMGKMLKTLGLSDAQETQIRGIMADVRKQNADVTDSDQRHANYKAAMDKVKAVLTPAQRTKLEAEMAAAKQSQPPHS